MSEPKYEQIEADHPISLIAHSITANAFELSAQFGISRMDLCAALANAIGKILADAAKPAEPASWHNLAWSHRQDYAA